MYNHVKVFASINSDNVHLKIASIGLLTPIFCQQFIIRVSQRKCDHNLLENWNAQRNTNLDHTVRADSCLFITMNWILSNRAITTSCSLDQFVHFDWFTSHLVMFINLFSVYDTQMHRNSRDSCHSSIVTHVICYECAFFGRSIETVLLMHSFRIFGCLFLKDSIPKIHMNTWPNFQTDDAPYSPVHQPNTNVCTIC